MATVPLRALLIGLSPAFSLSLALALTACSSDTPTGVNAAPGRTFAVTVGGEVQLRLQSIGPGEYLAPPQLSSMNARFVGVSLVGPAVPAGVTQRFSFVGVAPGTTVVTFVHSGSAATIVDTLHVQ
jgi:hypothetical protein